LRRRLGARGREAPGDVEARIAREAPDFPAGVAVVTIVNDSTIELAEARFNAALLELLPSAETFV
jgi:ribose 1,5-bisphosphokinase PhnN